MKSNIISVKYEDNFYPNTFSGKSYAYYTNIDLNIGDIVEAPSQYGENIAIVSEINISPEEIENIKPYMKTITKKINRDRYLNFNEILEDVA